MWMTHKFSEKNTEISFPKMKNLFSEKLRKLNFPKINFPNTPFSEIKNIFRKCKINFFPESFGGTCSMLIET